LFITVLKARGDETRGLAAFITVTNNSLVFYLDYVRCCSFVQVCFSKVLQKIFVRIYRHRHIRQSALPDKNAGNTGLFVYYIYTAITDIYIWMLNKLVCRSFSAKQYANDI
jgi:hypothetical protein